MKVSLSWLKELVEYNLSAQKLADELSLKSIGVKQVTDDFLELDLTYNRGDLLSLRGVAFEVSALTDSKIKFSENEEYIWNKLGLPKALVEVEQEKLAPVYCVAKIEGLKVDKSNPDWVKKLADSGLRSINNVADITNLIMVEYGQPMHAFDAKKVKDETLVVRVAKKEEELITLDGKVRKLDSEDLLIADSEKALGLAGVMGGKDSEISDATTTILLEAAIFDPTCNRSTSKRHGLYSDASKRFQHGLSPQRTLQALDAAIKLYQSLGGKLTTLTLKGDFNPTKKPLNLSLKKTNSLLGLDLDKEVISSCLKKLGFDVEDQDSDNLKVFSPYFRLDINIEEDLIEEVARMYGYEKIEGTPLPDEQIPALDQTVPNFILDLKLKLKDLGLTEVQTYSFYSTAVFASIQSPKTDLKDYLKIANPISSETQVLRMDIWPNLLEVVGKNINKGYKEIGIFEIGKLYFRNGEGKPAEKYTLAIALVNDSDNPLEELVSIIQTLKLADLILNPSKETSILFHPKRILDIEKAGQRIGGAGEAHLRLLNKLGIEKRVAVLEISLEKLV